MDKDQLDLVREVLATVGTAGSEVVSQYAKWHFVDNIVWVLCGAMTVALAVYIIPKWKTEDEDDFDIGLKWVVIGLMVFFGAMGVASNIAGIYAPEAEAINRLLNQIAK